jgi:hypothetical protein
MLFEPESLLCLARKSGLNLYRRGGLVIIESQSGGAISKVWAEAIKRHKPELLPLLPKQTTATKRPPAQAETADLFGPVPPKPKRTRLSMTRGNPRHLATAKPASPVASLQDV